VFIFTFIVSVNKIYRFSISITTYSCTHLLRR